ncbi:FAD-binding and (Fe-S)-binding domain-containing protein [Mesorhizobium koreense]|uniref:FAD-binding and (Fe-S)-binding domain-containing protein n=1 Tax=Mesorhizobium koreense TaxID=3074855 RepID=UPI00287B8B74|nr:FAD-linked oxidase C-terminal domain-containing protein [Mesorhizobium sp. WR6]
MSEARVGIGTRHVGLERRLARDVRGEVKFDALTRGLYATDASIYQIFPVGVVFPRDVADVQACLGAAAEFGVPIIARGAGTSQNGQPIGAGLVLDMSRHFSGILDLDLEAGTVIVRPGTVLEQLNSVVRRHGLFFPVEPSTASRCTLGGMAGNNSSGARSMRYGKMVDNVLAIEAVDAEGELFRFGRSPSASSVHGRIADTLERLLAVAHAEAGEIERTFPKVQRRVGGYNLDELIRKPANPAGLLVGSEGTLSVTTELTLKLARLPAGRVMGVCHFPSFRSAMEATASLVDLGPTAVELVDNNILTLGRDIPLFRNTLAAITRGTPDCLLLVEFAGADEASLAIDLQRLDECMADLGFPDAVVEITQPDSQKLVWGMREACLNIMMSMRGDRKPVSFIEDCAVPLEHLADYTDAMTELFARNGIRGTWYAHASVGCLHVRPILDMKDVADIATMRALAETACDMVKRFKGSFSGEHGDGISRSEFIEPMFGRRMTAVFEAVKQGFDPNNRLNPGKIVRPFKMDDRSLMRFAPSYRVTEPATPILDWSAFGGFGGAVEMCNNNGTCRKLSGGTMCPSYRVMRDERHVTRGRANALRLAMSGQLGADAFTSAEMKASLDLCVSCKGCRRECPTGVDMAKLKIEFLHQYYERHGLPLRERLIAYLPRYARHAGRLAPLINLRNRVPFAAKLSERMLGFSARRTLPVWRRTWDAPSRTSAGPVAGDGRDIVLFADTFNSHFEAENLDAAVRVLGAAGYRVHHAQAADGGRGPCCGRTFLSAGMVEEARKEAERSAAMLLPYVRAGARIVGLEPSCLLTFRDEYESLLPPEDFKALAEASLLFDELLAPDAGRIADLLGIRDQGGRVARVHGHCHQKSMDALAPLEKLLGAIPGLDVRVIDSSCCGMAGAFGYGAETIDVSMAMGELTLLPEVRKTGPDDVIVANGTSCRHQIHDGAGRDAIHIIRFLDELIQTDTGAAPARNRST